MYPSTIKPSTAVGRVASLFARSFGRLKRLRQGNRFRNSTDYWQNRYSMGGNSGVGSYAQFADFKAKVLNSFVQQNDVESVIEFGCGDGNQLALANYPIYFGYDVSPVALQHCRKRFKNDSSKRFEMMDAYQGQTADLALSLDVIFHLVEDDVFRSYMGNLFRSAERFVIIYSSNIDEPTHKSSPHVRHRNFSAWVDENTRGWKLARQIPNDYPFNEDLQTGSFADFFIYERTVDATA